MMDRRFDMMNFEQSLKDHADQFRLVPSKRVWTGIYNNLHPGSKWPSLTMAIVISLTLISVGYLNNTSKKETARVAALPTIHIESASNDNSKSTNNNNFILENNSKTETDQQSINNNDAAKDVGNERLSVRKDGNKTLNINTASQEKLSRSSVPPNKTTSSNVNDLSGEGESIAPDQISTNSMTGVAPNIQNLAVVEGNEVFSNDNNLFAKHQNVISINKHLVIPEYVDYNLTPVSVVNTIYFFSPSMTNLSSPIDARVQEPKKTYPKKIHIKRNKNIEWTYYITPTISNAVFGGSALSSSTINYSPLTVFQRSNSNGMMYNAKFGFETGAKMTYKLPKNWKFVTGFNLNYSDYNVVSNPIHPTFATLMLKDKVSGVLYPKNYITFYGDGQSNYQTGLNNYSLQFSIPLGIEYQVWGNEKMQINIASAIEPSVVLKSHSYIISNDARYYVEDPDLMRRMNLGANLGTFISFGSNKIKWHIGPDVHYQLLSTYKDVYPGKEHLINYGIRIGISKKY
jgi:hypothetical protein